MTVFLSMTGREVKKSKKSADVINGRPFTKSNFGIFNIDIDYEQPVFLLQIHYILSLPVGQAVAKYQVQSERQSALRTSFVVLFCTSHFLAKLPTHALKSYCTVS